MRKTSAVAGVFFCLKLCVFNSLFLSQIAYHTIFDSNHSIRVIDYVFLFLLLHLYPKLKSGRLAE